MNIYNRNKSLGSQHLFYCSQESKCVVIINDVKKGDSFAKLLVIFLTFKTDGTAKNKCNNSPNLDVTILYLETFLVEYSFRYVSNKEKE